MKNHQKFNRGKSDPYKDVMKISELIDLLQDQMNEFGDLPVFYAAGADDRMQLLSDYVDDDDNPTKLWIDIGN